ncbi:MAG TPA: GntR family transcriptional regulator [Desulfomonilia bacterium]|nr:GntR family transcriptional regulator [Desulfomonilia bacterium]
MGKLTEPSLLNNKPGQEREKPLPRRIADIIIARIFMGELNPGDRLPPDRVLAEQLGVDRTSLRAALNELASRHIVRAVQGSGVVVLDYREHAGLDFLDAVFGMSDIDLGSAFNIELLDHWIEVVPAILKLALRRATPSDLASIDSLFRRQLDSMKKGIDYQELAAIEVEIQDEIVKLAGSTILRLFANSMRRLRVQFVASFLKTVDIQKHILAQRTIIQLIMAGGTTPDESASRFKMYLHEQTRAHRARIARMASSPNRRSERKPPRSPANGRKP